MPVRIDFLHDPIAWDQIVTELGGKILQSWRWGEFKSRHGWEPIRLLVQDEQHAAAAQILVRRAWGFSILYIPRGPVARDTSPFLAGTLRNAVGEIARRYRAITVIAEPENAASATLLSKPLGWSESPLVIQPRRTLRLHLESDEELLRQMKPKTRYNIRLAFRRGVTTRIAHPSEISEFYTLLLETAQRDGFGVHDLAYFRDLLECFEGHAALIFAEYEHQLAAAALVVRFGDEAVYLYGASRTALQRHMPAYAVQWAAIQWARQQGCQWYDLWGLAVDEEEPPAHEERLNQRGGLWGVSRFKLGFGGEPYTYPGTRELVRHRWLRHLWQRLWSRGA